MSELKKRIVFFLWVLASLALIFYSFIQFDLILAGNNGIPLFINFIRRFYNEPTFMILIVSLVAYVILTLIILKFCKRIYSKIALFLPLILIIGMFFYMDAIIPAHDGGASFAKPVIYLYPQGETQVSVKLDINGKLTYTYPEYNDGWNVEAFPDGTLINDADNKEYSYLFWEGKSATEFDLSKGFVVAGSDTAKFLQEKLAFMGLTPKEYNEFIVYWAPQMENNPYNLITFQGADYTDSAKLDISPTPDSVLRVFMAYKPLKESISLPEQSLQTFQRKGFSVVEWGGTEVK